MKTVIRNSYTPQIGDYCDTIVVDRESWIKYLFDCDGVFTEWSRGKTITSLEDYREKYKDTDVFSTGVVKEKFDSIDAIDEDLQTQIDDIKAASDVVDIVGTYADLQNYDTSKLNDNDIIKVLADETHDGDITYYRWSTSTQSFTYIGSVTFDTQLSFTSTNPVENQGIAHSIYTEGTGANAGKDLGIDLNFINPVPSTYVNIGTQDTSTRGQKSVAIGLGSKATGENSTAIGFNNTASAFNTVALGYNNTATNQDGVAIGFSVNATGNYGSLAAGSSGTTANAMWTTAIGHGYVQASSNYATAIGNSGVTASANYTTAIGNSGATASGQMATAVGSAVRAEGEYSVAIGRSAYAYNNFDLALGYSASTKSGNNAAVAIGSLAQAQGNYSIALGYAAGVSPASGTTADNTIAIGHNVYPAKDNMISIGSGIYGGEAGGVAIGANTAARGTDSVALGKGSIASAANTVSVGDGSAQTPLYRRITNVDDAIDDHDAITKYQLDTAIAGVTVPVMTGATATTAGASGLVPAPAAGDQDKCLKGDGTWATVRPGQDALIIREWS